jgi:hypothetical protein
LYERPGVLKGNHVGRVQFAWITLLFLEGSTEDNTSWENPNPLFGSEAVSTMALTPLFLLLLLSHYTGRDR